MYAPATAVAVRRWLRPPGCSGRPAGPWRTGTRRRRVLAGIVAALVVCWAVPLGQQLTSSPGNLRLLVAGTFAGDAPDPWSRAPGCGTSRPRSGHVPVWLRRPAAAELLLGRECARGPGPGRAGAAPGRPRGSRPERRARGSSRSRRGGRSWSPISGRRWRSGGSPPPACCRSVYAQLVLWPVGIGTWCVLGWAAVRGGRALAGTISRSGAQRSSAAPGTGSRLPGPAAVAGRGRPAARRRGRPRPSGSTRAVASLGRAAGKRDRPGDRGAGPVGRASACRPRPARRQPLAVALPATRRSRPGLRPRAALCDRLPAARPGRPSGGGRRDPVGLESVPAVLAEGVRAGARGPRRNGPGRPGRRRRPAGTGPPGAPAVLTSPRLRRSLGSGR